MAERKEQICPVCGKVYKERSALSRKDNKTFICPDCGMQEALDDMANATQDLKKAITKGEKS